MKKVFTFTIDGVKYTYNTVKEMVEAKAQKQAQGIKIDEYSVKIEEVEEVKKVKASAKINFKKYEQENIYGEVVSRQLIVDVDVKAGNDQQAKELLYAMADKMDYEWFGCTEVENNVASDAFSVDFEYGQMSDVKKEIMEAYKQAKKSLGIR